MPTDVPECDAAEGTAALRYQTRALQTESQLAYLKRAASDPSIRDIPACVVHAQLL